MSPRLRDQELVLRILALFSSAASYRRPLKKFLNDFVAQHRRAHDPSLPELKQLLRARLN